MPVKFTEEQEKAISANGTVLVAAAAGSGKTAVLVERIIRRFCSEEAPLMADRALIVTFTNAAATELKTKIETGLRTCLAQKPQSDLLKKQNILIRNASICTIDSFCIQTVRNNFNLLDISRDFKISDKNDSDSREKDALDQLFLQKHQSGDESFQRILHEFKSGYDDSYLKSIVYKLYRKSLSMPYPREWINGILNKYNSIDNLALSDYCQTIFNNIVLLANNALSALHSLQNISEIDPVFTGKYFDAIEYKTEFVKSVLKSSGEANWDMCKILLDSYNSKTIAISATRCTELKPIIKAAETAIKELREYITNNISDDYDTVVEIFGIFLKAFDDITALVFEFSDEVEQLSKETNEYTFNQLEHMALNLFSGNDNSVIDSFNLLYDEILVDEYQDTSNLQDELFNILSRKKGQLFMVGDVKQSIYRFRNANPDNFLEKKEKYELYTGNEDPCKVLLRGNFRSRKEICEFINYIFTCLMTKADAGMDYNSDEALVPCAKYAENQEDKVEFRLLNCADNGNIYDYESEYIAKYIEDTMIKPPFIDDGNGGLRTAKYSDFAILLRSPKASGNRYAKALKKHGIPSNSSDNIFSESEEIIAATAMLKAIENVNDSISVYSLAKSPIFGITENELAEMRYSDKEIPLYKNLITAAENGNVKAANVIYFIKKAKTLNAMMPLNKLINELFSETSFIESFSVMDNGDIRRANLRQFAELAASYNNATGKGLKEFIRYLSVANVDAMYSAGSNADNSVLITTIHKSKGLQYPICILSDLRHNFNMEDLNCSFVCDENVGISFDFYSEKYGATLSPILRSAITDKMRSEICKEELRLLYVALTRAKEKLVLVSACNDMEKKLGSITELAETKYISDEKFAKGTLSLAKSYGDWLLLCALCHKDGIAFRRGNEDFSCSHFNCGFQMSLIDSEEVKELPEVTENAVSENAEPIPQYDLDGIFNYEYPFESVNSVPAKTSVTDILKREKSADLVFGSRPGFMSKSGLTPAEIGTATHKFMESCDYGAASLNIEKEIERLYEWQYISEKEAEAINRKSLSEFFKSYAYSLILKAEKVYKEYRFLSKVSAAELNPELAKDTTEYSLVQGVADCVIENANDIIIIDYKTDNTDNEEYLKQEYSRQIEMYSDALSKIFNKPVSKRILYSFSMEKCIEI